MTHARTMRMLYLGFVAAVLSTLAFAGLLIPSQTGASALGFEADQSIAASVPASRGDSIDRLLMKAAASLQAKSSTEQMRSIPASPSIELTALMPTQPLAQPAVRAAADVIAPAAPDSEPVPPLIVTYDIAPEADELVDPATWTIEERGEAALALLDVDLESLGYTISFEGLDRSYLGLAHMDTQHIQIFLRPGLPTIDIAFVIGHEIGHAVDHIHNDSADRAAWRAARGMDALQPWWPTNSATDWGTPAGDFAECFGWWITGGVSALSPSNCDGTEALLAELSGEAFEPAP